MTARRFLVFAALALPLLLRADAHAAGDVAGKWTASIETQFGQQNYTYEFVLNGSQFSGKAKSNLGEAVIKDGKVNGDAVTFTEVLKFMDMEVVFDYSGTITADEMKLTRKTGDISEPLVAKRAK
jgi:hypothetical protein